MKRLKQTLGGTVEKVKKLVEAGASVPTAIKEALAMDVGDFAQKYGRPSTRISSVINGSMRANDDDLAAFAAELGGTVDEWRMLLMRARMSSEELATLRQLEPSVPGHAAASKVA